MKRREIILKTCRLVGLIIFAFGGYLAYDFNQFRREALLVEATFEQVIERSGGDQEAQITFYDPSGKRYLFLQKITDLPKDFTVGDRFPFYFDRQHFDRSRIKTFWVEWEGVIIAAGGFGLFLGGLIPVIAQRRRRKRDRLR